MYIETLASSEPTIPKKPTPDNKTLLKTAPPSEVSTGAKRVRRNEAIKKPAAATQQQSMTNNPKPIHQRNSKKYFKRGIGPGSAPHATGIKQTFQKAAGSFSDGIGDGRSRGPRCRFAARSSKPHFSPTIPACGGRTNGSLHFGQRTSWPNRRKLAFTGFLQLGQVTTPSSSDSGSGVAIGTTAGKASSDASRSLVRAGTIGRGGSAAPTARE